MCCAVATQSKGENSLGSSWNHCIRIQQRQHNNHTHSDSCHRELRSGPILRVRGGNRRAEQPIGRRRPQWHHPEAVAPDRSHFSSSNPLMSCCCRFRHLRVSWRRRNKNLLCSTGTKQDFVVVSCSCAFFLTSSLFVFLFFFCFWTSQHSVSLFLYKQKHLWLTASSRQLCVKIKFWERNAVFLFLCGRHKSRGNKKCSVLKQCALPDASQHYWVSPCVLISLPLEFHYHCLMSKAQTRLYRGDTLLWIICQQDSKDSRMTWCVFKRRLTSHLQSVSFDCDLFMDQ